MWWAEVIKYIPLEETRMAQPNLENWIRIIDLEPIYLKSFVHKSPVILYDRTYLDDHG